MTKSPLAFQRLKAAPQKRQLEPNPETTAKDPGVASDFESGGDDQMTDSTFQPSLTRQREGFASEPQAGEQTDLAPRCRTILPKQQRRCRRRESSGDAKRSRRPARNFSQEFVFGPRTLIEKLDGFGKAMRPRQLAGLLSIGRSTLYEWVEKGTIPAYKHRGVVFFDPLKIANWLRQQEVTS
jgi:excisionase family DNA binding protein